MNMIVNTSDLVGYEAEKIAKATSARSEALAKAVAIWENNQFKSAKRLGGFGMLAITLAACNNDDDTAAADVATQLAAAQAAQAAAETAQAAAEAALASISAEAAAPAAAAVSILTANVDTVVAAATGDTVSSGIVGTIQALQSVDQINMGAGDDTLTAIISTAVTPQLTDVETLNFSGTAAVTVDLSASTGYSTIVNTGSSGLLTVSNIAAGTSLSLSNNTAGAGFTVSAAAFTGAADALTISLSNVTNGTTTMSNSIETLTINSTGGATNTFNTATVVPTTVNVTGDTALTYAEGLTTATTVNAGDFTATLTSTWDPAAAYTYTGGSGTDTLTLTGTTAVVETVNLGAGNDRVTLAANLGNTDVLNGGDGTDTLSSTSALIAGLTNATAATDNISNFEAITLTNALGNAITGANVQKTGLDTYNIPGGGNTLTMAAGAMNVNLSASLTGGLTMVDTGTATSDSVTISNTALVADDMGDAQALVSTGYETVNIVANSVGGATSQDFSTIAITADTGGASSLVITGNSPLTTTGAITAATIDASGMTGEARATDTFVMGAAGVGSATITGSPGDDTLIGIAAAATTISGGAGEDTITGGTAGDTISGGAGNDTITAGTGAAATTADTVTGGDGDDTITMDTGTHNVDGGAGNDSIDMAATLSTGDVISGGEGTDSLIVNANPTAATAGQVSNFETIQINNNTAALNMAVFGANPGFTTITTNAATQTITNATSSVTQIEFDVDGTGQTTITFTRLVDGAADTIDLETSADTAITTVSIANEEIVTIDAADGDHTYTNFTTTDMTSLVVTGDNNVNVGTSSGTNTAIVDASAMTETFAGDFSASIVAMTVSAPATFAGTITTGSGADTVTGSSGDDNITTNNGADVITMGTGNDTVDAGGANDTIIGSTTGTNGVTGGNGSDTMTGGSVVDTYVQTTTSSTAPSSISMAGATVAVGDSMTFANGVDIITNFSTTVGAAGATDDVINLGSTGVPTTLIGKTVTDVGGTDSYFGSGAWDANAKTFTFSADGIGGDMFVADVTNGTNDGVAAFTGGFVLIGVDSDNVVAGQFT